MCEKVVNSGQFLPIYWRKVINNPKKHQKPSSFGPNNKNKGSGYNDIFTLAFSHHKENNLDKAEELYTSCLDINSKDPLILHNLGVIFLQTGRLDNAIQKFYEAIKYKPKYLDALCNLGIALKNSGKLEEAILEKKIDPKKVIDAEVLTSAGMIKGKTDGVRLLGKGELTQSVRVEVSGASKSAKEAVEKLGGKVLILETKKTLNDRKSEEKRKSNAPEVSDKANLN